MQQNWATIMREVVAHQRPPWKHGSAAFGARQTHPPRTPYLAFLGSLARFPPFGSFVCWCCFGRLFADISGLPFFSRA